MIKTKLLSLALLLSSASLSASALGREAVINSIQAELLSGGVDSEVSVVRLSGTLEALAAGCEASRSLAKLNVERDAGSIRIVPSAEAFLVTSQEPCAPVADDFKGLPFTVTYKMKSDLLATVKVANVSSEGSEQSFLKLLKLESETPAFDVAACEARLARFCTREYRPSTCSFDGQVATGNNKCEARLKLQRNLCQAGIEAASDALVCVGSNVVFE